MYLYVTETDKYQQGDVCVSHLLLCVYSICIYCVRTMMNGWWNFVFKVK